MFSKKTIFGSLAGLGFLLGIYHVILSDAKNLRDASLTAVPSLRSGLSMTDYLFDCNLVSGVAVAQMPVEIPASASGHTQFRPIEQPLGLKVAVTVGGIALIGLDLWWFIFTKTKAAQSDKGKEGEGGQERILY